MSGESSGNQGEKEEDGLLRDLLVTLCHPHHPALHAPRSLQGLHQHQEVPSLQGHHLPGDRGLQMIPIPTELNTNLTDILPTPNKLFRNNEESKRIPSNLYSIFEV